MTARMGAGFADAARCGEGDIPKWYLRVESTAGSATWGWNPRREDVVNETLRLLMSRRSVREYDRSRPLEEGTRKAVIDAAMRAPTAGNMMLYSVIEVEDREKRERLVETCDDQPFIARAPMVLLFLADYQRTFDYFMASGVEEVCGRLGREPRKPGEGELLMACCDALIAAQTAVIAAESLGVGSCYVGDIMERYEEQREMFDLPAYVFPAALVCFGYPTEEEMSREQTPRFDREFVVFRDGYRRLSGDDLARMFEERERVLFGDREEVQGLRNFGQLLYFAKFDPEFARELTRSVRAAMEAWRRG